MSVELCSNVGRSAVAIVLAAVFVSVGGSSTTVAASGDITGTVRSQSGAEAGVWVIAETDDLDTGFRKIVVTDDDGRFLVPDLPDATYSVWVRGYGLADSSPVDASPGQDLSLTARQAATPQEAAQVFPASYWYSLLEVPAPSEFPGTGADGNGVGQSMQSQAQWVDRLKDGCQMCHQMGTRATRVVQNLSDFDSTVAAWDHRVRVGPSGPGMSGGLTGMGRPRGLELFADWSDRIAAGEVPPTPPRPQGVERNVVLTTWGWSTPAGFVHDEVVTDKRNPSVNANGPVYGVGFRMGSLAITDPVANASVELSIPMRQEFESRGSSYSADSPNFVPSPYWGADAPRGTPEVPHNPMMDAKGRVWMTSAIRRSDNPDWCKEGSGHPSATHFPIERSGRQISYYDPGTEKFVLVDSCYGTHHLHFAEDATDTLWFSGDTNVVGWLNTRMYDATGDERASQGWCPTVIDTNGDGRIGEYVEPGEAVDPTKDTRLGGFAYGVIPNPVDGSIWITRRLPVPGRILRLDLGDNPPETCIAEVYEPPFENPDVDPSQWGHGGRGIDVDRNGLIWTALGGSGHLASFDRSKCAVLNGPSATGQHCPEGWTLYQTPGPQMKGVTGAGSADFHYYNWVDQFNILGLGENVPIANGTTSDSLIALLPQTGEWVVMRVPYPLGFYSRGLDGRIDDPNAGWSGRGIWTSYNSTVNWHNEGGMGMTSEIIRFQIRPNPLAN
ncbi:MAG: hypothetical protein CL477_08050 [Acidobacteria bacterium]|jgi:hypothetical protein|nr:hypothetical protein [Acidobacteriota bacterium]MDP7480431.1 hypothetical protein [Vicinamibacterales bacterium]HJN44326.1 hypothetical protein [Vicinamibacterales bacterium]|tara:strand:- start:867 stop:3044 length:2178 start_codon:yes stop_codon:yes gene_type:complete